MPDRPALAVVTNALTPYRLHFHRRIVRELPEVALWSLFTHDQSDSPWAAEPPDDIRPVAFGAGEPTARQGRPRYALHEWRKGGRIIGWLHDHDVRAVVLGGYNDPGRLRIARWCRATGVPCFLFGDSNVRGDTATGIKARIKRAYVGRVLGLCAGALCCGTLGRDYFVRYGMPAKRVFFCPYEPDYDLIRATPPTPLPAGRKHVIYSGRLAAVKRVDLLIDAFAAIAVERPEWDLLIAGGGPLRTDLEARVPVSLAGRVRWLGFLDDQTALSSLYRAADVLVLPSDYEPWAVVVNEGVAAGLAVVASDAVGAAEDLVRDGRNGRVFPRGDLAALTVALRDVTAPGRAEALGAASAAVLAEWRRVADPVDGLRHALASVGVLHREP